MIDASGDVLYVGKAKNLKKRVVAYARPTGLDTRIERMIAATAAMEFVSTRTETEALLLEANLIKRLRPRFNVLLRDDKSFPYILITGDHWAPQILKHRGARTRPGRLFRPVRLGLGGQPHDQRAAARVPAALLLATAFFESRTRPCLLHQIKRCSAPCTGEIDARRLCASWCARRDAFLSGRSQAVKDELAAEMEEASDALDFERAARLPRPPRRALGHPGASGHQSARRRGGRRLRRRIRTAAQPASRCSSSAPARTGATAPISRKADRSLAPGEVLGAFLAQFYDDKPCPRLILLSHEIEDRALLAEALSHQEPATRSRSRCRSAARRRTWSSTRSPMRARRSAASSPRRRRSSKLLAALAEAFGLPRAPRRIEVYDNCHIHGHERGRRHDRRRAGGLSQEASTASSTSARTTSRPATISA